MYAKDESVVASLPETNIDVIHKYAQNIMCVKITVIFKIFQELLERLPAELVGEIASNTSKSPLSSV